MDILKKINRVLNEDSKDLSLIDAIKKNNIEEVKRLIKAGADVNKVNKYGKSALMYASNYSRTEIAKLLIDAGADVGAVNIDGWTEIAKLLKAAGAKK